MKKKYIVDGKIYEVPDNESAAFLKDFPNAKVSYNVEGKEYEIPHQEADAFELDMGLKKKEPASQNLPPTSKVSVTESSPTPSPFKRRGELPEGVAASGGTAIIKNKTKVEQQHDGKILFSTEPRTISKKGNLAEHMAVDRSKYDNRIGHIYNGLLDGVESLGAGTLDLAVGGILSEMQQKGLTVDGKPPAQAFNEWREFKEENRGTVKKMIGSDVTPEQEKKYNEETVTSALNGLANFAPAMAGGLTPMILQGYDSGLQSINSTEEGKKLPESTKTAFGAATGAAFGILQDFGLGKIFGKQSDKLALKLTTNAISKLTKEGVPITTEMLEKTLAAEAGNLKNKIINAGSKVAQATLIQSAIGGGMDAVNQGLEKVVNEATGKKVFDEQSWTDRLLRIGAATKHGAVSGVILGGTALPFSKSRNYIKEKVSESQSPTDITNLKNEITEQVKNGKMSPEEADQAYGMVDLYSQVNAKIPQGTPNRSEISDDIIHQEELKKEIEQKEKDLDNVHPSLQAEPLKEITALKNQLEIVNDEIAKKATSPQKDDTYIINNEPVSEELFLSHLNSKKVADYEYNGEDAEIIQKLKDVGGKSETTTTEEISQPTELKVTPTEQPSNVSSEGGKKEKTFLGNGLDRAEAKKIYAKVNEVDIVPDADQIALSYIAGGGKVGESGINEVAGTVKRARLNTGEREKKSSEAKSRDYYDKSGGSLDEIAHNLWERHGQEVSERDIKDALMDAIGSHNTRLEAAKTYLERYSAEYTEEKQREQFIKEHEEEVAAEEKAINEWLSSESEFEIEAMNDENFVTNLIKKYETESKAENQQSATETESSVNKGISSDASTEKTKQKVNEEPQNEVHQPTEVKEPTITEPNKEIKTTEEGNGKEPPSEGVKEGVTEGDELSGITHADTEINRKEQGFGEYERKPETEAQWAKEADERIAKGEMKDVYTKYKNGSTLSGAETVMIEKFKATLDKEVKNNPTDENINKYKELINTIEANQTAWGKQGRASQIKQAPFSNIGDFYVAKMEALGVDADGLTEKQKSEVKEEYDKIKKDRDDFKKSWEDAELRFQEEQAEKELLKAQLESKKSGKSSKVIKDGKRDFEAERKNLKDELKSLVDKYKNEGNKLGIAADGGAESFKISAQMAKVVLKIAANHAEQVGVKLSEVVKRTHDEIKDIIEGITERDIRDVLAGKYSEKKKTRDEIAAMMRELSTEQKLLDEYESLLKKEPQKEKDKVIKNKRLAELRKKIDGLKKEEGVGKYSDEEKVKRLIDTNKRKQEEFQRKLKEGDFEPTKKPSSFMDDPEFKIKNPQLYNKAMDSYNKMHQSQLDYEKGLLKHELENSGALSKAARIFGKSRGFVKAMYAGYDLSSSLVQNAYAFFTHPLLWTKMQTKYAFPSLFSSSLFDRYLADLHNSNDWNIIKESGLRVSEPKSLLDVGREEAYPDRWRLMVKIKGKQYPQVEVAGKKYNLESLAQAFERHFTMLSNAIRVTGFRTDAEQLYKKGYTFEKNPDKFEKLATRWNNATGSGKANEHLERMSNVTNLAIWSSRLMSAKLNILGVSDVFGTLSAGKLGTKGYYRSLGTKGKVLSREQVQAVGDLAKFVVSVSAATYGAAIAGGGKVQTDPEKPGFFDVKFPNGKTYNFTGGFSNYFSMIWKVARGRSKDNLGVAKDRSSLSQRAGDVLHFMRGKTPPITGSAISAGLGKDYSGKPTDVVTEAEKYKMPMAVGNIVDQINKDGYGALLSEGILTFMGANVKDESDYTKHKFSDESQKIIEKNQIQIKYPSKKYLKNEEKLDMTEDEYSDFLSIIDGGIDEYIKYIKKNGAPIKSYGFVYNVPFDKLKPDEIQELVKDYQTRITSYAKSIKFPHAEKSDIDKDAEKEQTEQNNAIFEQLKSGIKIPSK